jgi:Disulphide bond corrector protein DsbC
MLTRLTKSWLVATLLCIPLAGQEQFAAKTPSVIMSPAPLATVQRGSGHPVELHFRVGTGFHVNSNTPTEEFLIPTVLTLEAPTDIIIGRITYPPGELETFPFAPDQKLSVYAGEFTVSVLVRPLASVLPSDYAVHGTLKYQACDNAACYPPKRLSVEFNVKVIKSPSARKANPPQSPHAHS